MTDVKSYTQQKNGHIVVLTGATLEGSGLNLYIVNNAIEWKKMGFRVTIICQDRNAQKLSVVDSYIQGKFPEDAPKLQSGQLRVVVPDINNLIPIFDTNQYCEFPGVTSKAVHQMTQEELETNINMTIPCLRDVCAHDMPFKVIANYIILSGVIAARGLEGLNIPYDIIVIGPGLIYSVYPYPHLWKWVLPGFKRSSVIFQHTEFVKTQFLKCFKTIAQQYKLRQRIRYIPPGVDPSKFKFCQGNKQLQKQLLLKIKQKIQANGPKQAVEKLKLQKKITPQQIHQQFTKKNKISQNTIESDLLEKWVPFSQHDETILYVGALLNSKGVGELLTIAPKLITQRPKLKFIFCGSGPFREHLHQLLNTYESGDFQRAKIIAQAGEFSTQVNIEDHFVKIDKKLKDRIIFAGLLEPEMIHRLYPFATILLVPSKMQQSCSMGIVQAMFCGVTPICNDHSWFSQVIGTIERDYQELSEVIRVDRGQFFEKLPETIIQTLDFIENAKSSKTEYRETIRNIAVKNFSWNTTATLLAEQRQYKENP